MFPMCLEDIIWFLQYVFTQQSSVLGIMMIIRISQMRKIVMK